MNSGSQKLAIARLCDHLEALTGMTLSGTAPQRLRAFLERRARHLGLNSADAYVDFVCAQSPRDAEPTQLVNLITNGLTAFWRDEPQLDAARQAMLDLYKRNRRPLTIWCAGCSTGEEAYTMAMLASELELPYEVLGTDINTDSLQIAKQATYNEWSLRRLSAERQQRHLSQSPSGDWVVNKHLQQRVQFRQRNLIDKAPPSPSGRGWDLILCRNVFIYLREDAILNALMRFAEAINPDGYLMLGSSEQLLGDQLATRAPFRATRHASGFVYRLHTKPPGETVMGLPTLHEPSTGAVWVEQALEEETIEFDADLVVERLMRSALEHIERGAAEPALACCEATLSYDPFVIDTCCLIGLMMMGLGAAQRAAESFRKVLFLDPSHWLAAFELGRIHELTGEHERARQLYYQALEGLDHVGAPPFTFDFLNTYFERAGISRADEIRQVCQDAILAIANP